MSEKGSDPSVITEARSVANDITDPADRSEALVAIATALATHDPTTATAVLTEARSVANDITNPADRSNELVAIATALATHDPTSAWEAVAALAIDPDFRTAAQYLGDLIGAFGEPVIGPVIVWIRDHRRRRSGSDPFLDN
jgi:hypothetical protein